MVVEQRDGRRTATRERLVVAGQSQFRRYGVGPVGVGDVCRRAGVTKGVFAHHFPGGKEELVLAVVARNRAEVADALAHALAGGDGPAAAVESLFAGYARLMRDAGPDLGCPVVASVVDASARSAAVRAEAADTFTSWRAALSAVVPADQAQLVLAAFEGAIVLARADAEPAVLEEVGRTLGALFAGATAEPR